LTAYYKQPTAGEKKLSSPFLSLNPGLRFEGLNFQNEKHFHRCADGKQFDAKLEIQQLQD
jgi:hypothetical protein